MPCNRVFGGSGNIYFLPNCNLGFQAYLTNLTGLLRPLISGAPSSSGIFLHSTFHVLEPGGDLVLGWGVLSTVFIIGLRDLVQKGNSIRCQQHRVNLNGRIPLHCQNVTQGKYGGHYVLYVSITTSFLSIF